MTLELIVFIGAILFGILLYWRESNGNKLYRLVDKIVNAKHLQMKEDDKTGFVYRQKFLLRVVYITAFFILLMVILKFLIPINYTTISIFASCIVGTLIGTYVANFVLKSGKIIDEKGDSLQDIEEPEANQVEEAEPSDDAVKPEEPKEDKKSARDRLKDKGYLK